MTSTRTSTLLDSTSPVAAPNHYQNLTAASSGKSRYDHHAQTNGQQRKDVTVRLQYLKDDPLYKTVKPIQVTPFWEGGKTNVRLEAGPPETMNDVRGLEQNFTLDTNGFRYVKAPTQFKDWNSQPQIAKEYLPELEQLLKREVEGCDEVMFYDARIRQAGEGGARVQGLSYNPFARQVHVDNTEISVIEKIRSITEMKADFLLTGRARIVNIWRPIKHPVYDCGLAIADGGKLQENDVIECERHRLDTDEYWDTMGVIKHRPGYDWYYMSMQDEADVLLFKNYDSATDVQARHCLHTAFDLPPGDVPANAPTRESIEVRALVFTHPKGIREPYGGLPQPLVHHLERGNLKLVDEEHSITDRLRTDIDEANEVKDAVLVLRRQEIRRLENEREALMVERDDLQGELRQAQQQISIQSAHGEALQAKVQALELQLSYSYSDLHRQNHQLSKELSDARIYEQTRPRLETDTGTAMVHKSETALLLERIESQQLEIEKWKGEAMIKANEAVSHCWQGSVDEAIRREREKDGFVIKALLEEIERLKVGGTA